MSAIVIVGKMPGGDVFHKFGGIECDVEGCGKLAPSLDEMKKLDKNLMQLGWFIAPGQHRCPEHFHTDAPAKGVIHRHVDNPT